METKEVSGWDKVKDVIGIAIEKAGPILQPMLEARMNKPQPIVTPEQLRAMQMEHIRRQQMAQAPPQPPKEAPVMVNTPIGEREMAKTEDYYDDAEEQEQYESPK